MTQKKNYSRYFIILQEDEKGYAIASDKIPSGYAKLEMKNDKCKISYYVQNLKKEKGPYYMILICNKKDVKSIIKIGMMNIDDYGRMEIAYEYPIDNIADTKISMDKIMGAAIVTLKDNNVFSAMSGFASTEIPTDWKEYKIVETIKESEIRQIEVEDIKEKTEVEIQGSVEVSNAEVEKNVFDEYEQSIEASKVTSEGNRSDAVEVQEVILETKEESEEENRESKDPKPTSEVEIDENLNRNEEEKILEQDEEQSIEEEKVAEENRTLEAEEKELVQITDEEKKEPENIENKGAAQNIEYEYRDSVEPTNEEEVSEERHHHKHSKEKAPKDEMGKFFGVLVDEFEEMEELCKEIKRCKWFKVPSKNLDAIPDASCYNKHTIIYYPMMPYYHCIKKYGHYLFGYKCGSKGDIKYLIYGVPGRRSRKEQPFEGRTGFVTWIPLKPGEEEIDSFGYWLLFYDFKNSVIIIPRK